MRFLNKKYYPVSLLAIFYMVGVIGLMSAYRETFLLFTPFIILGAVAILFLYHKDWGAPFILFIFCCYGAGFFIEWVGVKTGLPFGHYAYGKTLGWKLWDVPLIIGLNWILLIYTTGMISDKLRSHWLLKLLFGALLMVFLDILIEPVAIRYDFWQWENTRVPALNYIGWFVVSFALLLLFYILKFEKKNSAALPVYILQLLFFGILNFLNQCIL